MANRTFILIINIIYLFLFSSCSEELVTETHKGGAPDDGNLKAPAGPVLAEGEALIESGVSPSGNAYKLVSRWVLDHYEAEQGIVLGTWPREQRYNPGRLKELHAMWGFNYLLYREIYGLSRIEIAKAAGFPPSKMMVAVSPYQFRDIITYLGSDVYAYYCDEPADRNLGLDSVNTFKKNMATQNLFLISGYKRTTKLDTFVLATDGVAFSSYAHWYPLFGFWVSWPENPDQRQDWTDMQRRYGSKFSFTWIGAHMDLREYDQLLEHARKLGLKSIWLFQHQDETDDLNNSNVSIFALYAWKHQFLVRYERREILRIENALSDDNLQSGNPSKENWTVTETINTRQMRTVKPEDRPELFNK